MFMHLEHRVRACNFWMPFLHNSFICFSNIKLLSTATPKSLSLELPSVEKRLILMEFQLKGDTNK